ncbi:MAG: glycine cleavage H-protein [Bacteroidetes bacterium]|nr:glycine cleavage H-protein [Bacteroidota bacterium]
MTVLLVLFTLIVFLTLDHFIQKSRTPRLSMAGERIGTRAQLPMQFPIHVPDNIALATNHTWLRTNKDGTVTIGLDEFLSRLVGKVEKVSIPCAGDIIAPEVADIAMGVQGHSLRVAPPMSGDVIESNLDILRDPSLILRDPYGEGWLLRVRSRNDDATSWRRYVVGKPVEWLRAQAVLVRDFIVMNAHQGQPVTMQEGGLPMDGVMQQFDENVWKDFNRSFAMLHKTKDTECKENQI